MQKISSYLYPNRINLVADVALFPVRWNIVYQNRIKIYKGVDNLLTLDVKNSDQKRIDISEMTLKMAVMDINGNEIIISDVTAGATTGLATVNIPATSLEDFTPQFFNFTIYRENEDTTKTVLYADTQFGVKGNMELVDSAVPVNVAHRYITRFIPLEDDISRTSPPFVTTWYSDAVEVRLPNFFRPASEDQMLLDFKYTGLEAEVTVQYTTDDVIGAATDWVDIETFSVVPSTVTETKDYSSEYTREMAWVRIKYIPEITNAGKVDKVTVRL